MIEPGSSLPAFNLVDHHGNAVSNRDLMGAWSVIWWYVRADTPG